MSRDPAQRAARLAGLPEQPVLIHQIESPVARDLESALHDRFRLHRVRGEWFALTEADVDLFRGVSFCAAIDALPATLQPSASWARRRFRPTPGKEQKRRRPLEKPVPIDTTSRRALMDALRSALARSTM